MDIHAQEAARVPTQMLCLLGAAPLLGASDTLTNAFGLGIALFTCAVGSALSASIVRALHPTFRFAGNLLLLAALVSVIAQVYAAWLPQLQMTLTIFVALIAPNLLLILHLQSDPALDTWQAAGRGVRTVCIIILIVLIVGTLRELVGRGSLLHDGTRLFDAAASVALQLFPVDLGFLLAQSPPGAFMALGLLLALYNAWSHWSATRSKRTHEPEKDR